MFWERHLVRVCKEFWQSRGPQAPTALGQDLFDLLTHVLFHNNGAGRGGFGGMTRGRIGGGGGEGGLQRGENVSARLEGRRL